MRIRAFLIALVVVEFAILAGAITLSHRRATADTQALVRTPSDLESQAKRTERGDQFQSEVVAFERTVVTDSPFSATLQIEQISEGSNETRTATSLLYRDAEGRTRRDQMRANSADRPETTTINDPVAGFAYVLKHSESTARRTRLRSHAAEKSRDSMEAMRNSVTEQKRAGSYQMLPVPANGPRELKPKGVLVIVGESKSESLGEKEIEGVIAEGTRTITTIPAGAMGNDRTLEIVTERWYSPKLKSVVLVERLDPRFGRSAYRLTRILHTDQAANLFSVPGKYKVLVE
jgi:hypothetical protein